MNLYEDNPLKCYILLSLKPGHHAMMSLEKKFSSNGRERKNNDNVWLDDETRQKTNVTDGKKLFLTMTDFFYPCVSQMLQEAIWVNLTLLTSK